MEQVREDARLRGYTAAAMFGCGALIGLVEAFIPGGAPVSVTPGVIALVLAIALVAVGPRLSLRQSAVLGPLAVAVIAYALTFNPGPGDGAVLYMWPVLWTVFFYGRRGAIAIVAAVAAAHGGVLLSLPSASGYFNRWIDVMSSVSIVAAIFDLLVRRNEQLVVRLAGEARVDALSGILNRRGFDERAAIELAHALREQRTLTLVVFDIDHFKQINDEWGHDTGDQVIAHVARLLDTNTRAVDAVARIGGEEFVVLMPGAATQDANGFTERIRAALTEATGAKLPTVRVSAGIASAQPPASIEILLQSADRALYTAKRDGRNRTIVAPPQPAALAPAR